MTLVPSLEAQGYGPRLERPFSMAVESSEDPDRMVESLLSDPPQEGADPLRAFVKSAVLPGWSQWTSGQARTWAYLAWEGLTWGLFLHRRALGDRRRTDYRDLAWERGRLQVGVREDGDFDFYERMGNFERSGAFDLDPTTTGLQPEEDASTYNGRIWGLAVGLFLGPGPVGPGAPGYESALEYYRERAYSEAFLWDWSQDPASRQEFRGLIEESDDAFRTARIAVGLVVANHVTSALDAFLSTRGPLESLSSAVYPAETHPGAVVWEWRLTFP